jgi:DNA-3-methyladenine glycosylase II
MPAAKTATPLDVRDRDQLADAVKKLTRACSVMKAAHKSVGVPDWRLRPGGYAGLARIIAYQQVSTRAAATIWGRVEAGLGTITPEKVLAAPIDELRGYGLSRPKVAHIRSIATAITDGSLNLRRVARASDDDARAELVAVSGIGPWTADVYLMFSLGRTDVFPHADIGLSEAYRMLTGEEVRRPPKDFLLVGEAWRPWRAVASHLLWAHINKVRSEATGGA